MTINWPRMFDYLYGNRVAIVSGMTLLVGAAVKTAPMPGSRFNSYTWIYDFLHQFLNITNTRLAESPVPTVPLPPIVEAKEPVLIPK